MSVNVTMNLKLPDFGGMLFETERTVLTNGGIAAIDVAADIWQGWAYGTQYSPPRKYRGQIGTSLGAWHFTEQLTQAPYSIKIHNDAQTKKGKHYAAFVHRVGQPQSPEFLKVLQSIISEVVPDMRQGLIDEYKKNIGRERVVKTIRTNRPNIGTEHFSIE